MVKEKDFEIRDPRVPAQSKRDALGNYLPLPFVSPRSTGYDQLGSAEDGTGVEQASGLVYVATGLACVAGSLCGYDTGLTVAVVGNNPDSAYATADTVASWFSLKSPEQLSMASASTFGAVVASIVMTGIGEHLGRRRELVLAGLLFIFGSALSVGALQRTSNWNEENEEWSDFQMLLCGRAIYGCGTAMTLHAAPVFIAEIAPATNRGMLVGLREIAVILGVVCGWALPRLIGFEENFGAWRWCFGAAAIPALAVTIGFLCLPSSPRWVRLKALLHPEKYNRSDALMALHSYRRTDEDGPVECEMEQIDQALSCNGADLSTHHGLCSTLSDVFQKRKSIVPALGLCLLRHITGYGTVLYWTFMILTPSATGTAALLIAVRLSTSIISVALLNRVGRYTLLLYGSAAMVAVLVGLGVLVSTALMPLPLETEQLSFHVGLQLVAGCCIALFVSGFQVLSLVTGVITSELFPLRTRGVAMGVIVALSSTLQLIALYWHLTFESIATSPASLFLHVCTGIFLLAFVRCEVPETKDQTLEQIETELAIADHPVACPSPRVELSVVMGRRNIAKASLSRRSPKLLSKCVPPPTNAPLSSPVPSSPSSLTSIKQRTPTSSAPSSPVPSSLVAESPKTSPTYAPKVQEFVEMSDLYLRDE